MVTIHGFTKLIKNNADQRAVRKHIHFIASCLHTSTTRIYTIKVASKPFAVVHDDNLSLQRA